MNSLLLTLKQQINELANQAKQKKVSHLSQVLFDDNLFGSQHSEQDISFYLDKINKTYQILSDSIHSNSINSNSIEKVTFFSDLIVNQIAALTRELSTNYLRNNGPNVIYESLPEKHARHLNYLRRLQEMKYELELNSDDLDYKKIATLDNRIYRCEQAIKQIEKQMENDSYF